MAGNKLLVLILVAGLALAIGLFLFLKPGALPEDGEGSPPLSGGGPGGAGPRKPGTGETDRAAEPGGAEEEKPPGIEPLYPGFPVCSFRGRLVREEGAPVPGAMVLLFETAGEVFQRDRIFTGRKTKTGEGGRYLFERVPTGRSYMIRCGVEGAAFVEVHCPAAEEGKTVTIADALLRSPLACSGTVTDGDGHPIGGARVEALSRWEHMSGVPAKYCSSRTVTDPSGRFTLTNLSLEEYIVTAEAAGYVPAGRPLLLGFIGEAAGKPTLDFSLDKGLLAISGRVVVPPDRPFPGAEVAISTPGPDERPLFTRRVRTDSEGRFTVGGLSQRPHRIIARAAGHCPKTIHVVTPGGDEITVELVKTAVIEARIEAGSGLPGRFTVEVDEFLPLWVEAPEPEFGKHSFEKRAAFRLTDLPPGLYILVVKAEGYAWTYSGDIEVESGETARDAVIRLAAGGSVTGRLTDRNGRGVAGADVRLRTRDFDPGRPFRHQSEIRSEQEKRVRSNKDGSFRMSNILPGFYSLEITGSGMAPMLRRRIRVGDGEEVDLKTVVVAPGGSLEGTVFDRSGRPVRGGRVVAANKHTGRCKAAVTDNGGSFSMHALAAGLYKVYLDDIFRVGPGLTSDVTVPVKMNETSPVEIRVRPGRKKR